MNTIPARIQRDLALLRRVPRVGHRYRTRPLARVVRWWLRAQARADAEDAMQRHRSALKACLAEGVSYRYAREVQDRRMRGERLARGSACRLVNAVSRLRSAG